MGGYVFIIKCIGFNPVTGVSPLFFACMCSPPPYSLCLPHVSNNNSSERLVLKHANFCGRQLFKSIPSRIFKKTVLMPSEIGISSTSDFQPRIKTRLRSLPTSCLLFNACNATVEPFLFVNGYASNLGAPLGTCNSDLSAGLTKAEAIKAQEMFTAVRKQYIMSKKMEVFLTANPHATASHIEAAQESIDFPKETSAWCIYITSA